MRRTFFQKKYFYRPCLKNVLFEDTIFCRFFSLHFFADYGYIKNMESQENSSAGIYKVLIL